MIRLVRLRTVILAVAACLVAACSSGLQVRSDEDPQADFDSYRTWNFFDQLGIEGGYNSPVFGEHFRAAVSSQLSQRGYVQSDDPDLYVNVTIRSDEKVEMRSYTRPYMSGAYYAQPGGGPYHGSSVGVGVGSVSRATRVTEASVFIDLVDNRTDRLVWQGVAVTEANDATAQRLRDAIYTAVDRVFKLYPYSLEP